MKTKTITVNIREDAEKKLRQLAEVKYGKRKGYLGKALSEAVDEWAEKTEKSDVDVRAIAMLKKGYNMGGFKTKKRSEWHER